jgi:hypothetical protein
MHGGICGLVRCKGWFCCVCMALCESVSAVVMMGSIVLWGSAALHATDVKRHLVPYCTSWRGLGWGLAGLGCCARQVTHCVVCG